MKDDLEDQIAWALGGVFAMLVIIGLCLISLVGCASTSSQTYDCPPVEPPEEIYLVETLPPEPLPLPRMQEIEWTLNPFVNAVRVAEAQAKYIEELVGIIRANNEAANAAD